MLSHCIGPSSFCMPTMIPIPKGSGSMGDIKKNLNVLHWAVYMCMLDAAKAFDCVN